MRFIVGARQTRAPYDLENFFHWHGDAFADGQLIDTITPRRAGSVVNDLKHRAEPVWTPAMSDSWRAVWAFSTKRYRRDQKTLNAQRNRALAAIAGDKPARKPRFVTQQASGLSFNQKAWDRACRLAGLKGYVTNIQADIMTPAEVIASYHELWRVEQSFRMSKSDLRARPIFHHTREAIEAHLTIVMAALAVSRHLYAATGITTKRLIKQLKQLREVDIELPAGQTITAKPKIDENTQKILKRLGH